MNDATSQAQPTRTRIHSSMRLHYVALRLASTKHSPVLCPDSGTLATGSHKIVAYMQMGIYVETIGPRAVIENVYLDVL